MTQKEIDNKIEELYDKIDSLDEEKDVDEIRELRNKIAELDYLDPEPEEFSFEVTITGKITVKALNLKEAEALVYDSCKNHEFIAVQRVEVEED